MNHLRLISTLAASLAVAGCAADGSLRPTDTDAAAAHGRESKDFLVLERIRHPIWKPVDFQMFTAKIGSFESGFAEFGAVTEALLPPPKHVPALPAFGTGPGSPHGPPYGRELAKSVAANGFVDRHIFGPAAFSAKTENGVYLVFMIVPRPGTNGRSPDFRSGPIIPNAVFPITIKGVAFRNGEVFDPFLAPESELPPLDEKVAPRFAGMDGHSHIPIFLADNQLLGPPNTPEYGWYRYLITLKDRDGNGWRIVARFQVRRTGKLQP